MKKLILIVLSLMVTSNAFSAWTATVKETRKADDTLFVDTVFTDGTNTERVEVPLFQPKDKAEAIQGLKNRAATLERKYNAMQTIDVVKPEVDKEKDKPIPCLSIVK